MLAVQYCRSLNGICTIFYGIRKAQTYCHIQNGVSTTLIVLWRSLRLGRMLLKLSVFCSLSFGGANSFWKDEQCLLRNTVQNYKKTANQRRKDVKILYFCANLLRSDALLRVKLVGFTDYFHKEAEGAVFLIDNSPCSPWLYL